jgi:imidazolonepropionase-like amidohydrolase
MILDDKPVSAPTISLIVDTPERAEEVVAFLAGQGASFIKVYNSLKEDQLKAVIKAAHARGLPVAGHIPRLITMTRAVELGMDCLEHILVTGRDLLSSEEANKIEFLPVGKREALLWQRYDLNSENLRSLVSLLAERKVFLDPTLTIDEAVAVGDHTMALRDPNNRFLSKALFDRLSIQPDAFKIPVELKEVAASSFIKREKFVKKLNDAGVRLLAGTDGPGLGTLVPGFGLHHELKLLVESGLTPLQAIQTTTINAASALRKDTELGAVEPGKLADLVILDANPLQDINNISRIQLVMKDGRIYYPALLFPAKTN